MERLELQYVRSMLRESGSDHVVPMGQNVIEATIRDPGRNTGYIRDQILSPVLSGSRRFFYGWHLLPTGVEEVFLIRADRLHRGWVNIKDAIKRVSDGLELDDVEA